MKQRGRRRAETGRVRRGGGEEREGDKSAQMKRMQARLTLWACASLSWADSCWLDPEGVRRVDQCLDRHLKGPLGRRHLPRLFGSTHIADREAAEEAPINTNFSLMQGQGQAASERIKCVPPWAVPAPILLGVFSVLRK